MKDTLLRIFLLLNLIFLDQAVKFLVIDYIARGLEKFSVISNFIDVIYVENPGIAFGLLSTLNKKVIYFSTLLIFLIIILCIFRKTYFAKPKLIYIIIMSGALSNFLDRVIRGFVVDYIKLVFFPPVFNLADVYIVVGTTFLILEMVFKGSFCKTKRRPYSNVKKEDR